MRTQIQNDIKNLIPAHSYDNNNDVRQIIKSNYDALRKSADTIIETSISNYLKSLKHKNGLLPPGTWFKNHIIDLFNGGQLGKIEAEFWFESLYKFKKEKLITLGNGIFQIREKPVK